MTDQPPHRNVEIFYGNRVVTSAYVTVSPAVSHTVRASVHAQSGHIPAGSRTNLIDAILELPEVQASAHLEVTVPLGDAESIQRLGQRHLPHDHQSRWRQRPHRRGPARGSISSPRHANRPHHRDDIHRPSVVRW